MMASGTFAAHIFVTLALWFHTVQRNWDRAASSATMMLGNMKIVGQIHSWQTQ